MLFDITRFNEKKEKLLELINTFKGKENNIIESFLESFEKKEIPIDQDQYVIIPNVVIPNQQFTIFQKIFLEFDINWKKIIEDNKALRFKFLLKNLFKLGYPDILEDLVKILKIFFFWHKVTGFVILKSVPGAKIQKLHSDFQSQGKNEILDDDEVPYTFLIPLEGDFIIHFENNDQNENIIIPQYSMIIFSGDCFHAEGEYSGNSGLRIQGYLTTRKHKVEPKMKFYKKN